jgi:translation initiation factor 1A
MPNMTGGKNYKKTKHSSEKAKFIEAEEGQLYARVIQILGNRNTLAYCNDNVVRLCHIRGSIRKDTWINIGDIVLISTRDFLQDKKDKYEKGDILSKYDRELYSKLKKDVNINPKLFSNLETASIDQLNRIKELKVDRSLLNQNDLEDNDDLFEDAEEQPEDNAESDDVDIDNI